MKKQTYFVWVVIDKHVDYQAAGKGNSENTWIRKGMEYLKNSAKDGEIWVRSEKDTKWKILGYQLGDAWPTFKEFY